MAARLIGILFLLGLAVVPLWLVLRVEQVSSPVFPPQLLRYLTERNRRLIVN